ncbi:GNAT family N-acetyltransferase [Pararhodospirillum oryzae]|uniref:N-acetyltransferase n=1 Tax=Pararhodospirillum oryzae TaxID=478448 RepID=A0A512H3X4_9PROT|nr:GNAT family N-acetyltransferase [Pararhodospirillum oryzae]GEO80166.1 hypothetical protein ROR02_02970 [Pararhodospirillum oryzae]
MPHATGSLALRFVQAIDDVPASSWDACAGPDNPFVSHAFLNALEASDSVGEGSGWAPLHAVLEDGQGRVRACAPLYLKAHSYGEYVFDWEWARAWEKAGGRYYPKAQVAVPFTPVTGPRLLVAPCEEGERDATQGLLAEGIVSLTRRLGLSGLHVTFCSEAEARLLESQGFLARQGFQYHWDNPGYRDFDDFLATLTSRRRKAIRKERERANAQGVRFVTLRGAAIEPRHWAAFDRFYRDTVDRKWGGAYLTEDFFPRLGQALGDQVVLIMGEEEDGGALVCGALNLVGGTTLFGRTWGAAGPYRFLHFEACYYRAMDYAIAHGLTRVEAGAQGEHKLSRGYRPQPTWSAHWIADRAFRAAVADALSRERIHVAQAMAQLAEATPFRCEESLP